MFKIGDIVEVKSPAQWAEKYTNVAGQHKILKMKPVNVSTGKELAYVLSGIISTEYPGQEIYWWEGFLNKVKDGRNLPEWF